MFIRFFERIRNEDKGFTLIELMVVVLIIAILIAIAIPTFLGARQRANDRAAQSSLRNALTAAKTLFTDDQDYTDASDTALKTVEPSLGYVTSTANSTSHTIVSVNPVSSSEWRGAALSKSGTCFYIKDVTVATGGGTTYARVDGDGTQGCASGTDPAGGYSDTGWQ